MSQATVSKATPAVERSSSSAADPCTRSESRSQPTTSCEANRRGRSHPPAVPLVAILGTLRDLLNGMTDDQYTQKPVGAFGSSIGGQTRHTLDHVEALLRGIQPGTVDYDKRDRGTDVETCRHAAIAAIDGFIPGLLAIEAEDLDQPVRLSVMLASDADAMNMPSCIGRELAFVQSHTIHHNAMIAAMARHLDVPVPERFGYAPSTEAYLDNAQASTSSG